jgi:hypothetical protein
MILLQKMIIEILSAQYIEGYKIALAFSDGKKITVDFEPFLQKSTNPWIRRYLDLEKFKGFSLEYGDLIWDDYDLCFPIADLYEGGI